MFGPSIARIPPSCWRLPMEWREMFNQSQLCARGDKRTKIRQDKSSINVGCATHCGVKLLFFISWTHGRIRTWEGKWRVGFWRVVWRKTFLKKYWPESHNFYCSRQINCTELCLLISWFPTDQWLPNCIIGNSCLAQSDTLGVSPGVYFNSQGIEAKSNVPDWYPKWNAFIASDRTLQTSALWPDPGFGKSPPSHEWCLPFCISVLRTVYKTCGATAEQ